MTTLPRIRTRGQWEELYKNVGNTFKKKKNRGGIDDRLIRSVLESESIYHGEQDCILIGESRLPNHKNVMCRRSIESCATGSGDLKGNGVDEKDIARDVIPTDAILLSKRTNNGIKCNNAPLGRVLRSNRISKGVDGNVADSADCSLRSNKIDKGINDNVDSTGKVSTAKRAAEEVKKCNTVKKKSKRGRNDTIPRNVVDSESTSLRNHDFELISQKFEPISQKGSDAHKDVECTKGTKKCDAGNIAHLGRVLRSKRIYKVIDGNVASASKPSAKTVDGEDKYCNTSKKKNKKKKRTCGGNSRVARNVVGYASVSNGDQGFVLIGDSRIDVNNEVECTKGITKSVVGFGGIRGNVVEDEEDRTANVAPLRPVLRSNRAYKGIKGIVPSGRWNLRGQRVPEGVKDKNVVDDDAFVPDNSSVGTHVPESKPKSKGDNCSKDVGSCSYGDNEKKDVDYTHFYYNSESGSSVPDSLGSDRMVKYSDSQVPNSRESDNVDDSYFSESTSNDNRDPSDADYEERQCSSKDTYVSYASEKEDECNLDDDANGDLLNAESKKNGTDEIDQSYKIDESDKNGKNGHLLDDGDIVEGYNGDIGKSSPAQSICQQNQGHRVGKKESTDIIQENGETDVEGFHGDEIRYNGTHSSEKNEGMVFVIDLEKKVPNIKRKFGNLEILVDFDDDSDDMIKQTTREKHPRHPPNPNSQNKKTLKNGKFRYGADPFIYVHKESMLMGDQQRSREEIAKSCKKKISGVKFFDLIQVLLDSIESMPDRVARVEVNDLFQAPLPLKFKFDDDVVQPIPEKSDLEKEIELLFLDLELGLQQVDIEDAANYAMTTNNDITPVEIDDSPKTCCDQGDHNIILDEQIGILCLHCNAVLLEIRHILPPFCTKSFWRQERRYFVDESPRYIVDDGIQFHDSACRHHRTPPLNRAKGTVWDLIPGVERDLFPHQREGFEFIWKNVVGGIIIDELKENLTEEDGRGCIISHAPGTGKSRLAIVFLTAFMKLYPNSRPVIIAPKGMILTWEEEFKKWKVDIAFHNMNTSELSRTETRVASELARQHENGAILKECKQVVKLYSWMKGGGVLGISYPLFVKLAGEYRKDGGVIHQQILRNVILNKPGLLILDEGHTPRNDKTLIWKAVSNVATQRRIILSGTPFQNNFKELKNTLHLVNPKFMSKRKWKAITNSIGKGEDVEKLQEMLDPFVHVYEGTILQKSLPGLRDMIVFLRPTDFQKSFLEVATKERDYFRRTYLVSLASVHPSILAEEEGFSAHRKRLLEMESDIDKGVKSKFVMNIVKLAASVDERVLIFSQYIDSLLFIQKQLKSHLSWNLGREVLYMDGKVDQKLRQDSIISFNDHLSDAKVLLASERACSEGINLIGASRVVLLDTVWNPSVEKQAISRAYRYGQKKVVHVYRLIISGTEIRQYQMQTKKELLSQLIFSRGNDEEMSCDVWDDKILEAMNSLDIFEKIIHQPKTSDWIETFGLADTQQKTF